MSCKLTAVTKEGLQSDVRIQYEDKVSVQLTDFT